ncbi:uncharacterized protein KNAG_0I02020 [Huiozyma naganishii CBS 8797]|uniref:Transcription factor TFIIIC triple barrel domain-containing protein n=1 Tax=Huiozyma naganishii (strain ATCC MYA-139 / BCRC 22969 / CBS 8797 / KCTC 17520 / NBRC 10181 / NCYC 3082 / Yp74L-3) TaxID=1071383 RepID=J7S2F8_HUIN7|nr:hypothetical protein KNAG_0I02020 [Kazachstania naganishii CBS 8797]CCK71987.1 hypothetical protein KNAG_0I02020 [Kazachstania naganishii CBS 8797]
MAVKTIYIVRHGYRSNWLPEGPYPPPPTGIENDVPLAEHGLEQSEELSEHIAQLEVKPQVIFTSPFYRCLQTISPTKKKLQIPLYVDRGLGEWFKKDRDVVPTPASNGVIGKFFPGLLAGEWEDSVIPSKSGESETDIFARAHAFWPVFIGHVEREFPDVETVILVTHAATKAALGMNLLKFPNAREAIDEQGTMIRNGSCALDRFDCRARGQDFYGGEWELVTNGDTSFLTNGEEMNWNFQNRFEAGSDADIRARRLTAAAKGKLE